MEARIVKKMNIVTSVWLDEVCGGDGRGTLYMEGEKRFTAGGLSRSWKLVLL